MTTRTDLLPLETSSIRLNVLKQFSSKVNNSLLLKYKLFQILFDLCKIF